MQPTRYYRVVGQLGKATFTKRLLARGDSKEVLAALNEAYPEVHFFQVVECSELDELDIIKFID